jgi:16S rRNA (uracil1498-N3)-methyltransferase
MPRFYCPAPLHTGLALELPAGAARHVQVLRMQPGEQITLFNHGPGWEHGLGPLDVGGEFEATITQMGRSNVGVEIGAHLSQEREARRSVTLLVGMPANERMDWLVEKATEIGVSAIQPLMSERSVLRLSGERAQKKVAHWQSVAIAACEQCGGNRVPLVHDVCTLPQWLGRAGPSTTNAASPLRYLLSLRTGSVALHSLPAGNEPVQFLCGPEGGLSPAEEEAALASGFVAVSLGPRVLRSETAALAALTLLAL